MSHSSWGDNGVQHAAYCCGGCGTMLEDATGTPVSPSVKRFETAGADGTPVLLMYCLRCDPEKGTT